MTKIKLFRLERDLKAKDLAKDLDIHPGTISTLENRKVRASKWARYKLSSFYGVRNRNYFPMTGMQFDKIKNRLNARDGRKLSSFFGVPEEELFNEIGYAKSILLRR